MGFEYLDIAYDLAMRNFSSADEVSELIKKHLPDTNKSTVNIAFRIFKIAYKNISDDEALARVISNLKLWAPRFHQMLGQGIKKFILNVISGSNWTGKHVALRDYDDLISFLRRIEKVFGVKIPSFEEIISDMFKKENYMRVINRPKFKKRYLKIIYGATRNGIIRIEEYAKFKRKLNKIDSWITRKRKLERKAAVDYLMGKFKTLKEAADHYGVKERIVELIIRNMKERGYFERLLARIRKRRPRIRMHRKRKYRRKSAPDTKSPPSSNKGSRD